MRVPLLHLPAFHCSLRHSPLPHSLLLPLPSFLFSFILPSLFSLLSSPFPLLPPPFLLLTSAPPFPPFRLSSIRPFLPPPLSRGQAQQNVKCTERGEDQRHSIYCSGNVKYIIPFSINLLL